MKKFIIPLAVILILSFLVVGCSSTGTAATNSPVATTPNTAAQTTTAQSSPNISPSSNSPTTAAPTSASTPQYGGTFTWIWNVGITAVGAPADLPTQTQSLLLELPVLEQLVTVNDQEQIQPGLAQSVDVSPDGKTITFHLRQGIKFQDGTDFNAAAVEYNLEQDLANNCSGSAVLKEVTSYDTPDDYTLVVHLAQYDARFLLTLAQTGIGEIASPTAMKKPATPETMAIHVVGTGPFKFDSWQPNQYIKFTKWDGYWQKGKPYLDAIKLETSSDVATSIMSFKAGEVNMVENIDPSDYVALKQAGYAVGIPNNMGFVFSIIPDSANPDSPFHDVRVREALEYALDKVSMTKGIGLGTQYPAYQCAIPTDPWYIQGLAERDYDVAKAKQLLAEAGYPNGFTTTLESDVRIRQDQLTAIQSYLQAVGIKATIDMADVARAATFPIQGWKGLLVPGFPNWSSFNGWVNFFDNSAMPYPSMIKPAGWKQSWDAVVAQPDYNTRITQMQGLLKQVYDQALVIPYLYDSPRFVTDGTVQNMQWDTHHTVSYYDPADMWLSKK